MSSLRTYFRIIIAAIPVVLASLVLYYRRKTQIAENKIDKIAEEKRLLEAETKLAIAKSKFEFNQSLLRKDLEKQEIQLDVVESKKSEKPKKDKDVYNVIIK